MSINPRNITTGLGRRGGYIFQGPLDAILPTDAKTELSSDLVSMGAASSDGFTRSIERSYETIRDFRGDEMMRTPTELSVPVSFALIETMKASVVRAVYGDDAVTVETDEEGEHGAIAFRGDETDPMAWVLDLAHGRSLRRFVFPDSQMVTESFEQEITNEQELRYPVELSMRPDESGNYFYEYWTNGYRRAASAA